MAVADADDPEYPALSMRGMHLGQGKGGLYGLFIIPDADEIRMDATAVQTVTLRAVDLLLKHGFDDGGLMDDILDANGFDSLARPCPETDENCLDPGFGGAVLAECVRRHIAPRLMGFEISYDVSLSHNPVRLARTDELDLDTVRYVLDDLTVDLTAQEVLAVAAGIADGYVEAGPGCSNPA